MTLIKFGANLRKPHETSRFLPRDALGLAQALDQRHRKAVLQAILGQAQLAQVGPGAPGPGWIGMKAWGVGLYHVISWLIAWLNPTGWGGPRGEKKGGKRQGRKSHVISCYTFSSDMT